MKLVLIMGLAMLFFSGCDDIFEKDISGQEVDLMAPADSVETVFRDQTFVWREKEGGTAYRLVIVRPSFREVELYVLDTLVAGYSYRVTLEPGEYEWAVRPENSAYRGVFNRRQLKVLEKTDKIEGKP